MARSSSKQRLKRLYSARRDALGLTRPFARGYGTAEGWPYVAAVMDCIVGWSMQATMTSRLVTDARMIALHRRAPPRRPNHSDQGSEIVIQFASHLVRHQAC